ncbi:DUF6783 domain-containing protein [Blautia sp. MSJ-9]|uniref:DUF6783 domain-containing protein n=1 Tax=Blautia sp. MSJ-9 TaxID=2841511 RepID=UPI002FE6CEE9
MPEFGCRSTLRRLIRTKSPTNRDAYLAESLFQTRSSIAKIKKKLWQSEKISG